MKISKRLLEYTCKDTENDVIEALGDYLDEKCWTSFSHIHQNLYKRILTCDVVEKDPLERRKKKLIFVRISEMKENIKEHYANQLSSQSVDYVCFYCEKELLDRGYDYGDLDHLLPKSFFPFLTLTPFNLVPLCQACNRGLKKTQLIADIDKVTPLNFKHIEYSIIHPYIDNKEDFFEIIFKDGKIISIKNNDEARVSKAKETIRMFELNEVFNLEREIKEEEMKAADSKISNFLTNKPL